MTDNHRINEDSLTEAIFARLSYLPDELLKAILFSREIWGDQPIIATKLKSGARFRPYWHANGCLPERKGVIPDAVFEFSEVLLIIEAKRWDQPMQRTTQLNDELTVAKLRYADRLLCLLAVGGLPDDERVEIGVCGDTRLRCAGVSWWKLFSLTQAMLEGEEPHLKRILSDIRLEFERHKNELPIFIDPHVKDFAVDIPDVTVAALRSWFPPQH